MGIGVCGAIAGLCALAPAAHASSVTYSTSLAGLTDGGPYRSSIDDSFGLGFTGDPNPHSGSEGLSLQKYTGDPQYLVGVTFTVDGNMTFSNDAETNIPIVGSSFTTNFTGAYALTQPQLGSLGQTVPTSVQGVTFPTSLSIGDRFMLQNYDPAAVSIMGNVAPANFGAFEGAGNIAGLGFSLTDDSTSNAANVLSVGDFNNWDAGFGPNGFASVTYTFVPEPGTLALMGSCVGTVGLALRRRRK